VIAEFERDVEKADGYERMLKQSRKIRGAGEGVAERTGSFRPCGGGLRRNFDATQFQNSRG